MRILMSIHHRLDPNSGAPGVTWQLANALRNRGHAVDVLSFDRVPGPERLKGYVYPWFVAGFIAKHPHYDVLDLSSGDGWIFSVLAKTRPRKAAPVIVARSHGLEHVAHEVRLRANRAGAHRLSWRYRIYHGGFRLWECGMSFSRANAALFLNDVDLQYAVDHLAVGANRAVRVRNGIAQHFIDSANSLLSDNPPSERPRNIAFIGRYTNMKGSRYLRPAMQSILRKHKTATFGLFGTMVNADDVLRDYPSELRDRIFVVPAYKNGDLPRLLATYHVLAFPSLSEGFPAAPLEAMACGIVPVVAASPGPMSYIQNGHNGIVVPVGDANALEEEIQNLLDDGSRWSALRKAGLATALNHSWDNVACDMEKIYECAPV